MMKYSGNLEMLSSTLMFLLLQICNQSIQHGKMLPVCLDVHLWWRSVVTICFSVVVPEL